jgi:hypothetical protein
LGVQKTKAELVAIYKKWLSELALIVPNAFAAADAFENAGRLSSSGFKNFMGQAKSSGALWAA